ncbi:MAG: TIM44-like domain-containing protein [Hyphomonadaceae bacterium]|nr:TIM44-like domain-containing protein [Hyphomonadaceae bacterium]
MSLARSGSLVLALAATLAFMIDAADARVGGGGSSGSRGSRTYTAPPSTNTAPKPAAPIERSMTQPGTATAAQGVKTPSTATAPSRFGSGFGGLLMGGLLGAGLFGLLSGSGLFGGLSGLASFLGLLLQAALIAGVIFLVMSYFRNRNQPALARASTGPGPSPSLRDMLSNRQGLGGIGGGATPGSDLTIGQDDYDAFEKLLGKVQTAYAREDTNALGNMTTPEMLSYFSQDLAEEQRKGVRFEVSDVKLLQGDLAEAWQEPGTDYATVAMRFSMIDVTLDRNTGRVIAGNRDVPTEATELWTFRRDHRELAEGWKLSAIQQA